VTSPLVYRRLDDVPAIPSCFALYRADMVSGIPDDDGAPVRFDRWTIAANEPEARDAFDAWTEDVHEGIEVRDVEKEDAL
jgi:hypothetical protein